MTRLSQCIKQHNCNHTNRFVIGVNEDDFVVFVYTILIHPVRVQNSQVTTSLSYTLLGCAPQSTLELEVVYTLADRLSESCTCNSNPPHQILHPFEIVCQDTPLATGFLRLPRRTRMRYTTYPCLAL